MPEIISIHDLGFPVLLWRNGYSYVASDAIELCTHPRSLFDETQRRAVAGEFRIADSRGRLFEVKSFERIRPFGGLKRIGHLILRSIFAAPVCVLIKPTPDNEFLDVVLKVAQNRFGKAFRRQLDGLSDSKEVLKAIAERDRKAG